MSAYGIGRVVAVNRRVSWGLLVTWLLHDLEELLTMPGWGRRNIPRLRRLYPRVPERVWSVLDMSRAQVYLAIGMMGAFVLAAAVDGARTGGRSKFFQVVLIGFGLHALLHLGQSALARGYTPGVVTAPVIVAPFSVWAWLQLDREGLAGEVGGGDAALAVAGFAVLVPALHGNARLMVWAVSRLRTRPAKT